ncbi:hypothetical protein A3J32_00500 [Candidatus Saccharibacteria bacterium RIFCSPLOWO2_02_FULL_46_7]|nr:MAG: hypothetical protein A3J32_00500 [Candidatus Saccharibacteria bacterium RIFCSPLOWO2_02_FULL_46_7]
MTAGFTIYVLVFKKDQQAPNLEAPCKDGLCQANQTQVKPISATTKHYASQNFRLEFDYPDDWTLTDEQASGIMTAKSPTITLEDTGSQKIDGLVTLTFRAKFQKLTEFDAGSATAVIDSIKIAYTKPTQSQRGETYISFLRYAKTTGTTSLDGIYITGDAGYKIGQSIPKDDLTRVDPVVSITFSRCSDNACNSTTPFSVGADIWDNRTISEPLLAMLKSLTIQ